VNGHGLSTKGIEGQTKSRRSYVPIRSDIKRMYNFIDKQS